ncbi:hypothetical protein ANCDUO_13557 [Ancylostoma duodenale]|uniref:Uncharacterized protein n=1 Tax=Ancylostoma duodenale TaxID=51022 RepID=A0A0C2CIN0_9BILA|nr:hypothetical protein ANCDUO_13557 [Ancylostoma duodenale]
MVKNSWSEARVARNSRCGSTPHADDVSSPSSWRRSIDMKVRPRKEPAMGVTRNLTEVFTLLRTNAQQNKFIYMNSSMPSTNRQ